MLKIINRLDSLTKMRLLHILQSFGFAFATMLTLNVIPAIVARAFLSSYIAFSYHLTFAYSSFLLALTAIVLIYILFAYLDVLGEILYKIRLLPNLLLAQLLVTNLLRSSSIIAIFFSVFLLICVITFSKSFLNYIETMMLKLSSQILSEDKDLIVLERIVKNTLSKESRLKYRVIGTEVSLLAKLDSIYLFRFRIISDSKNLLDSELFSSREEAYKHLTMKLEDIGAKNLNKSSDKILATIDEISVVGLIDSI